MLQADNTLMLVSEAGRLLEVSAATIRAWAKSGRLPAIRTAGGVRLFAARDVLKVKAERGTNIDGEAVP